MDDFEAEWEEYQKRKTEYLMNRKPERYKLINMGYGFVIADTVKAKYDDGKYEYHYFPDYSGKTEEEDNPRFYNIQDLVNELNYLDFQVNGNLYDKSYHILSNKKRIHTMLCNRLDEVLKDLVTNDSFEINLCNYMEPQMENININVNVSREGLEDCNVIDIGSPLLDNRMFLVFMSTINDYLDEVENSENRDDMIREDTLIELKIRLMERLRQINILNKMR